METDRLRLRQFRRADLDTYARILAHPDVARAFGHDPNTTREDAWRHMAMLLGHWQLLGFGRWALELRDTGEMIGRVGLWFPEGWPDIENGWVIEPQHWGKGYATEAAAEALRQGFRHLGGAHLISLIRPDNVASQRVAEKLGGAVERTIDFHGGPTLVYGYQTPPA